MDIAKRFIDALAKEDVYNNNNPLTENVYWEIYNIAMQAYVYGVITEEEFNAIEEYDNHKFEEMWDKIEQIESDIDGIIDNYYERMYSNED